jgi:dihydrofolate synthase / folylpolyglutamate synthase
VKRTLADWLALQESVHARSIDLGLERVARVARTLGIERPPFRVVTVGGTNGKGSTVAHAEAILRAGGTAVGAFMSPHLVRYNERIRIQGELASDVRLIDAFERIEAARGATTLTFFEYNTLAALLLFADARLDVAVLEVGLGGRLDATNLVDADVAVLTSVGLDHQDWLGSSLEAIGAEKAGIFRHGRPAVLSTPDMPTSVYARIGACGAHAVIAGRDFRHVVEGGRWHYESRRLRLQELPPPSLHGQLQYANAASAIAALEWLGEVRVDARTVSAALTTVSLPGRLQIVAGRPEWILDVAHNVPAARVLAQELALRPPRGRTLAVAGILRDKDTAGIAREMRECVDRWILCSLPGPRGMQADELAAALGVAGEGAACEPSVASACERALREARPEDRIVVFGSFLTVGPALEWLRLY